MSSRSLGRFRKDVGKVQLLSLRREFRNVVASGGPDGFEQCPTDTAVGAENDCPNWRNDFEHGINPGVLLGCLRGGYGHLGIHSETQQ
jgi:hypothetical protein